MAADRPSVLDVTHQVGIARLYRFMGNTIAENTTVAAVTDMADVLLYEQYISLDKLRLLLTSVYAEYPPPL
jgi:hypothetical protein